LAEPRRRAVFLDRDGTIIADRHYIADPGLVELVPGIGPAIERLNRAGVSVIVVTNQSGIGRGLVTEAEYARVAERMAELLAADGARIDATYVCPHAPDAANPCRCRKPGLLLFERAIADHGLDGAGSAFIGDRWRDIAPAKAFGGRAILVPTGETPPDERHAAEREAEVAPTAGDAVARFLRTS
jgi:histidinol-phosphate phosphatase family protein